MQLSQKTLVLIDGNAMLHRAFHAIPIMQTKNGTLVNAVYGFTSILLKIIDDFKPQAIAVAFDVEGGTFRDILYKEYKAQREKKPQELYDQLKPIKNILDACGIPFIEKKGFEADDVIGTIAESITKQHMDWRVQIVTGDMDTLQLVHDRVSVVSFKKGISETLVYDAPEVQKRFGLLPHELIDFKALKGDASDNIKGVKGIGEKTARSLIQKFHSIENLYDALSKKIVEKFFSASVIAKLAQDKDNAFLSKKLVTIVRDVQIVFDLERARWNGINAENGPAIEKVLADFEFYSLLKRIHSEKPHDAIVVSKKIEKKLKIIAVPLKFTLKECVEVLQNETMASIFFEKESQATIFSSSIAYCGIATAKKVFNVSLHELSDKDKTILANALCRAGFTLVGFDIKHLLHEFPELNPHSLSFIDLSIAEYLLHAGREVLLEQLLNEYGAHTFESELKTNDLQKYVAHVATGLLGVYEPLFNALKIQSQEKILFTIEQPLLPVLFEMEKNGIALEINVLESLGKEVRSIMETVSKKMFKLAGRTFNVQSPQQLGVILFDELNIPTHGIKRGKTGISTAASELEKLQGQHPIIDLIFEHRELAKLQSTYIEALPQLVGHNGRIHTTFSQITAATGRLASLNPNLQNIPVRTELGRRVRGAFVAAQGFSLLSLDYSQFELRIVAHLSKDPTLCQIFHEGKDVHASTAAKIHGIPLDEVTPAIRHSAKEVNFGVLYGMGPYGLAQRTGLSRSEASEFIEKYFATFPKLKEYVDALITVARKKGYAETMFGRRRLLPELASGVAQVKNAGERMAINMPIQGSQADMVKIAMINLDRAILHACNGEVRMLLQVHDELVFEVKKGTEKKWAEKIKKIMENVCILSVPVIVDVKVGDNWSDLKRL